MDKNISRLKPEAVWERFAEICAIPHPSFHEEAIREYIVTQARRMGLEQSIDRGNNVIIRKPATKGMEDRKSIILQAHADMVPQKNSDKEFDFEKDPIDAYIDGDWVTANGTTLGADNGMGLAAILAVMGSKDIAHGPLEALITSTEEAGMHGAFGLEPGELKGDILINLDSETEGELFVGCAGGLDAKIVFQYKKERIPAGYTPFAIEVKGLSGGHSGIEIILERGNANKILCRLLKSAEKEYGLRIASIDSGGLFNAIPREGRATVLVPQAEADKFVKYIPAFEAIVKEELKGVDDGLRIAALTAEMPAAVIDRDTQHKLLCAIEACPNGVMKMSSSMKGLVQTSTNLASVVSKDGTIDIQCLLRSSSNSEKEYLGDMISSVMELAGAKTELSGSYNGWAPNPSSPILGTMINGYKELFGNEPAVTAIHAGLECGIIAGNYPNLDMISFGPTIAYPHSPDEKVNVPSVAKFWEFLIHTLANAPKR